MMLYGPKLAVNWICYILAIEYVLTYYSVFNM